MVLYTSEEGFKDDKPDTGGDGRTQCPNCDASMGTKEELAQHVAESCKSLNKETNESAGGEEVSRPTQGLAKAPHSYPIWKTDTNSHTIDSLRRFPCEHCEKVFTDPSNLQRHIRSQHMGARSHACPECGKTFATSSGLKQHQHIHSSVKPFQCEVCLKAYTQFSNLCRHKRMHADCRQQIKCSDCGQAFSTITSLSKHKRFCEGALRNGLPLNLPSDMKSKLSTYGMSHSPAAFNPSMYMRLYGGRPPLPLFPQLGATTGLSPFSFGNNLDSLKYLPSAPFPTSVDFAFRAGMKDDINFRASAIRKYEEDHPVNKRMKFNKDASGSDGESEQNHSSDGESLSDVYDKKRNNSFDSERCDQIRFTTPLQNGFVRNPDSRNPSTSSLSPTGPRSTHERTDKSETETKHSKGEQPLDLSRAKDEEINEDTRKTHIYGEQRTSTPVSKPVVISPKPTKIISPIPKLALPSPSQMHLYEAETKERVERMIYERQLCSYPRLPFVGTGYQMPLLNPYALPLQTERHFPQLPGLQSFQGYPNFSEYGNLSVSPLMHKPKDRYSCKFCGKIFPRSANLTRHLRTHTGEQPYKCKYCERSFSISSNLQRHVRNIHNKEKPFRCPLCDRCFGQQTNLDRHLKKHETDGPNVIDSPGHETDSDYEVDDVFEDNDHDHNDIDINDEDEEIDVSENDDDDMSVVNTHMNIYAKHDILARDGENALESDERASKHIAVSENVSGSEDDSAEMSDNNQNGKPYQGACLPNIGLPVYQTPSLLCST